MAVEDLCDALIDAADRAGDTELGRSYGWRAETLGRYAAALSAAVG